MSHRCTKPCSMSRRSFLRAASAGFAAAAWRGLAQASAARAITTSNEKPVFLCNPSLPHDGILTVSHCTGPRRMNGKELEPARILTHYESDFGAAPKVEMRKGQEVTLLNPDFAGSRWLGIAGEIIGAPFHDMCRTQLDVAIKGDGERLAEEIRGFHWMVAYRAEEDTQPTEV